MGGHSRCGSTSSPGASGVEISPETGPDEVVGARVVARVVAKRGTRNVVRRGRRRGTAERRRVGRSILLRRRGDGGEAQGVERYLG
jgi:hypothetical protein